jgi:hypothetical protein
MAKSSGFSSEPPGSGSAVKSSKSVVPPVRRMPIVNPMTVVAKAPAVRIPHNINGSRLFDSSPKGYKSGR